MSYPIQRYIVFTTYLREPFSAEKQHAPFLNRNGAHTRGGRQQSRGRPYRRSIEPEILAGTHDLGQHRTWSRGLGNQHICSLSILPSHEPAAKSHRRLSPISPAEIPGSLFGYRNIGENILSRRRTGQQPRIGQQAPDQRAWINDFESKTSHQAGNASEETIIPGKKRKGERTGAEQVQLQGGQGVFPTDAAGKK